MNDTATATQPLELKKADKSPNFWLKTIEDCMPIPLSGVRVVFTNVFDDGTFQNYKLDVQPEAMRLFEEALIARGAKCNGAEVPLKSATAETKSATAETGHCKVKPASSLNKYRMSSRFDTHIEFIDRHGVDWAPKLIGDAKEKGAGHEYLNKCLTDETVRKGEYKVDMDVKVCGVSKKPYYRIQWEILRMRPHIYPTNGAGAGGGAGGGNNKRPADDQEYARCVCVRVDGSERQCLSLLRFNGHDDNPNCSNPKLSHVPVVWL